MGLDGKLPPIFSTEACPAGLSNFLGNNLLEGLAVIIYLMITQELYFEI